MAMRRSLIQQGSKQLGNFQARWISSSSVRRADVENPYPPFHGVGKENYGVLGQLEGKWVNAPGVFGMHTTPMPSPGTTSEQMFGAFHFKAQEYTEVLTFQKLGVPVRNRLGSNEQINAAVKYETTITDRNNEIQHIENGMYQWLGDNGSVQPPPYDSPRNLFSRQATDKTVKEDFTYPVLKAGALGPRFVPPYSVSRSGVIPHGATIHLMGSYKPVTGAPTIAPLWDPDSLAIDATMGVQANPELKDYDFIPGSRDKPAWTALPIADFPPPKGGYPPTVLDPTSGRAYFGRILNYEQKLKGPNNTKKLVPMWPYSAQPNLKLTDANKNLKINSFDLITLDTQHRTGLQGGILQNVGVDRYNKSARMKFRMWIEKVQEKGRVVDQLQYEQIIFFQFGFGSNGATTQWPHIQVNTLRRAEEVSKN